LKTSYSVTKPIFDDWYPREEYLPSVLTKRRQAMRYAIAGLFIAMNAAAGAWAAGPDSVTFNKDVLPIFLQNARPVIARVTLV
jgi:hypothetical protein